MNQSQSFVQQLPVLDLHYFAGRFSYVDAHHNRFWELPPFIDVGIRLRRRNAVLCSGVNLSEPTALTLSFQGRPVAQLQFMTRQGLICILLLSIAITPLLSIKIPEAVDSVTIIGDLTQF